MPGKFEVTQRKNGEYQFNLKASNGQVILTSEGYSSKAACMAGIESVRKHAQKDTAFERKTAKDGSPYFALMASNGQNIGKSEMYTSIAARNKGIASVMRNAADAKLADHTA